MIQTFVQQIAEINPIEIVRTENGKQNYACYKQLFYLYNFINRQKMRTMNAKSDNTLVYNPSNITEHSDQYTTVINTLKNINDREVICQDTEQQERTLNKIFVKTKTAKMQQIFINKLKRVLITKPPVQILKIHKIHGPCGISIQTIQFPDEFVHIIIFFHVIAILTQLVLSTLDGFIVNFKAQRNSVTFIIIKILGLLINFAYFILKCINGSFGNGKNVTYIHEAIKIYAKTGRLAIDFLMILFQILTLTFPDLQVISGIFFFFLIFVLFIAISDFIHIQAAYLHSENAFLLWGLIKVCLANIIIAHIMASIILAMSFIDSSNSWMVKVGIDNQQWWVKYVYAFYWGTTIMMTVGFGDVVPGNPKEIMVTSFLQMFSCIVLGYNISEIGHLISQIRQRTDSVNRKIAIFDRMVKSKGKQHAISTSLQEDIFNHIKQSNSTEHTLQFEHRKQLLSQLPEHLRQRYYQEANQNIFASVLFFNNLKPDTMEKIAQKFISQFYYQGENIIEANTKILILQQGNIGCGYKKRGSSRNGEINQEISVSIGSRTKLLTSGFLSLYRQRNYDLIAKSYSIVWHIDTEQFQNCIAESAIDFQYYFSVLHKHCFDEDEWETVQCSRCSNSRHKSFHVVYSCPMVVYKPFREMIAMRHITTSDLRQCPRVRNFRRKRNQYSQTSAILHKINFNILLQKISHLKRNSAVMTFIHNERQQSNTNIRQTNSKSISENQLLELKKIASQNPHILQMDEIINLFQIAIRRYQTGYQNGFWDLEVDSLNNFQFYFQNNNPNRYKRYSFHRDNLPDLNTIQRRRYMLSKQPSIAASSVFSVIDILNEDQ